MSAKTIFWLISTFLMLQYSLALPRPNDAKQDSLEATTTTEDTTTAKFIAEPDEVDLLVDYGFSAYEKFANITVLAARDVISKVITVAKAEPEPTEEFKTHTSMLSTFVYRVNHSYHTGARNMAHLLEDFQRIMKRFDTSKLEHPTQDERYFDASLKKHGFEEVKSDYFRRLPIFTQEFFNEVKKVVDGLSEPKKNLLFEPVEFCERFSKENDEEKRLQLIFNLMFL